MVNSLASINADNRVLPAIRKANKKERGHEKPYRL